MTKDETQHYYTKKPRVRHKPQVIEYALGANILRLHSDAGVFSRGHVDNGTDLLIKKAQVEGSRKVLDIGCGYGVVGIVMKRLHPEIEVVCSDINTRAVTLTKKNAKENKVELLSVAADGYAGLTNDFDCILSNPPQSAGKKVCFMIIEGAKDHLVNGGNLQLVARHQKGGKQLEKHMLEVFGNVDVVSRGSGFRIYRSFKN